VLSCESDVLTRTDVRSRGQTRPPESDVVLRADVLTDAAWPSRKEWLALLLRRGRDLAEQVRRAPEHVRDPVDAEQDRETRHRDPQGIERGGKGHDPGRRDGSYRQRYEKGGENSSAEARCRDRYVVDRRQEDDGRSLEERRAGTVHRCSQREYEVGDRFGDSEVLLGFLQRNG